jgi:hypothetical protein
VHRTYLAPGGIGKATLYPPRATLSPIGGAVVRLCRPREGAALVIGEGIETSLSAGLLTGLPAWAALSAGNMAAVHLPDDVREGWIASDHDAPGQRAAWQAADAFMAQGRAVQVLTPDTAGEDFNDIIMQRRMHQRNNWLVESHHPLRETIILQTGGDNETRASFLRGRQRTALDALVHEWEPRTASPYD